MRNGPRIWLLFMLLLGGVCAQGASTPYAMEGWTTPEHRIDRAVIATLQRHGQALRPPCSDAVFIRRVYLDVIGTLPTPEAVEAFLRDTRPEKRAALIDTLLAREEYADYWALKWCDLLRVKSEFPINLWPNAVQAYQHWVRQAIADNMPYDQFARALLTTNGSNFREPAANFLRAAPGRDPASLAQVTALTLMGTRLERWPEAKRREMAVFFSRVAYKKTGEWKEEIVLPDPAQTGPLRVVYPDGTSAMLPAGADPRQAFADWLITPRNPWFARNLCNRAWYWLLGHGIIHEADDIRPDNPPACPALLACLEEELVASGYDTRQLFRVILNSRTYQQSSLAPGDEPAATRFARYTVRRLDAEVLIDALCWLGGDGEQYVSPIPEPYTFIPPAQRTIALADGSITSPFLATFGRPARDSGVEAERNNRPSDAQRLYMLNSTDVQGRIARSPRLRALVSAARGDDTAIARGIYLLLLARYPTPDELAIARRYAHTPGLRGEQAVADLAWALVNSKEFLYRH